MQVRRPRARRCWRWWAVGARGGIFLTMMFVSLHAWGSLGQDEPTVDEARTRVIIADHFCPCQCGTHLPGSDRAPACFGCSVGKAEVTFIRESIAAGRPLREVLVALREPALVEVFADYDDPRLPEVWALAQAAAAAFAQHRVVLRSPGLDDDAMRAVEFAECARGTGRRAWMEMLWSTAWRALTSPPRWKGTAVTPGSVGCSGFPPSASTVCQSLLTTGRCVQRCGK